MGRIATISPTGGYDDISAVLDGAQPGDTIRLTAGTFQASWPIPRGVRVVGEGSDHTVVITDDSAFKLADGTAVEAMRIVARVPGFSSVHLEPGARGVQIRECVFDGVASYNLAVEGAEALVEGCTFAGGTTHGIVATDATLTIRGTRFQSHPSEPLVARRSRVNVSLSAFDTRPGSFQVWIDGGEVTFEETDFACGDIHTVAVRGDATVRVWGCSFQYYRRDDSAISPAAISVQDRAVADVRATTFAPAEVGATARALGVSLAGDASATVQKCRFEDLSTATAASGRGLLTLVANEFVRPRTSVRILWQGRLSMRAATLSDPALTCAYLAEGVGPEQTRVIVDEGQIHGHLQSQDPSQPAIFVPIDSTETG